MFLVFDINGARDSNDICSILNLHIPVSPCLSSWLEIVVNISSCLLQYRLVYLPTLPLGS